MPRAPRRQPCPGTSRCHICEDFLHDHQGRAFGAPGLTAWDVALRTGAHHRGRKAARVTGYAAEVHPGDAPLRGGSFARVLLTEALRTRRLPRSATPVPGRVRSPP